MPKTQRVVSFMLALFLLASSVGAVFLVIKQSNDQQTADELAQQLSETTANEQSNQETCTVPEAPTATTAGSPGDPIKLEAPVTELQITDLKEGTGEPVQLNDCITVNYRLSLIDGSIVAGNDTFASGQPIAFELIEGGLIEGWIKGIPGMKVGGSRRLVVPAAQAYGDQERSGIPANSTLVFDIELLDTKR